VLGNLLSQKEKNRYSRHFTLPQVGLEGQEKLKQKSVLCIGTGGLGSPAALYLAAAGIGKLGLIDTDHVDASNLQRQILHGESDIGRSKLESAKDSLLEINPHVEINLHHTRFTAANALELVSEYDIILDGSDNFPTRFASNDACALSKKPNIYGSIFQFEGQVSVFAPHLDGPCYRCMLPAPPPAGMVPSCSEAGVLGVLPGIIGSIQAMEAVKLCLGIGQSPIGKLLYYNALDSSMRSIKLAKNSSCPLCGDSPNITAPVHYEETCPTKMEIPEIESSELRQLLKGGLKETLIDVRENDERAIDLIEPSIHIPLKTIEPSIDRLSKEEHYILFCAGGMRSSKASEILLRHGFNKIRSLKGGMKAWNTTV